MPNRPTFHLVFEPNIRLVSTVRRFTNELYLRVLADAELASRLALATHEVLENAINYANGDETEIRIDIEDDVVNVRTWNRAAPERIEAIKNGIDGVMAAADPEAYYQEQMLVAAKRTDGSGLGARTNSQRGRDEPQLRDRSRPRVHSRRHEDRRRVARMTLQLAKLEESMLAADAAVADSVLTTKLRGTADVESRVGLERYVDELHKEACRLKMSKVVIDLRELEFMNSSSFKVFITWLSQIKELPLDAQYKIHLLSNPNLHWQRRSLAALSCFAVDLVTIET